MYNSLRNMARSLQDPRVNLYLLLLDSLRPFSRKELLQLLKLDEATLQRTLNFLYAHKLVDKRRLARK